MIKYTKQTLRATPHRDCAALSKHQKGLILTMKTITNTNSRKSLRECISDYTVIDLETTGLSPQNDEIIELAAVRVRGSRETARFNSLVRPEKPISRRITSITGITNKMTENSPTIGQIIGEYLDFIGNDIILGHNIVSFDRRFIENICKKLSLSPFDNDALDTYYFARRCCLNTPDLKLTTLTAYFGIKHNDAHRALGDCIANYKCYEKLKERISEKSQNKECTV